MYRNDEDLLQKYQPKICELTDFTLKELCDLEISQTVEESMVTFREVSEKEESEISVEEFNVMVRDENSYYNKYN